MELAKDIRNSLSDRRGVIGLSFKEEDHIYTLAGKTNYPSVSKVLTFFYDKFDKNGVSFKMSNGDCEEQKRLLDKWSEIGNRAAQLGSKVHYELEQISLDMFGVDVEARKPHFDLNEEETRRSDAMIKQGVKWLRLMKSRGALLVVTEAIMGDEDLGYTGQADLVFLVPKKGEKGYDLCLADWKTNKQKNMVINSYSKPMHQPFHFVMDYALGKYNMQLCFYERLLIKMLKDTKHSDMIIRGSIIVHLTDHGFTEHVVDRSVRSAVFNLPVPIKNKVN